MMGPPYSKTHRQIKHLPPPQTTPTISRAAPWAPRWALRGVLLGAVCPDRPGSLGTSFASGATEILLVSVALYRTPPPPLPPAGRALTSGVPAGVRPAGGEGGGHGPGPRPPPGSAAGRGPRRRPPGAAPQGGGVDAHVYMRICKNGF